MVMLGNIKATSMSNPVISENGTKAWYVDGKLHRVDGPAVEYADDIKSWWVYDKRYTSNKAFQKAAKLTDEEMAKVILRHGNVE